MKVVSNFNNVDLKYQEIRRLAAMLDAAGIQHVKKQVPILGTVGAQILCSDEDGQFVSVIQHPGMQSPQLDRLEIMGLLTPEQLEVDEVLPALTAEEVFRRIYNHIMDRP